MNETLQKQPYSENWILFINFLFAAVAALSIERLQPIVLDVPDSTFARYSLNIYMYFCAFSFFIYFVSIYNYLIRLFPYTISVLSYSRLYIDLVQVIVFFLFVSRSLTVEPEQHFITLIVTITFWHLAAMIWHVLAVLEHRRPSTLFALPGMAAPHIVFVLMYWTLPILLFFKLDVLAIIGSEIRKGVEDGVFSLFDHKLVLEELNLRSTEITVVFFTLVLLISIFRWRQVIRRSQS